MPFFLHSAPLPPLSPLKLVQPRKFFYLRSNERRLRSCFETLITLLQTLPFHLLQATFLYETGLITATTNAENLRQYKIRFSLIAEQTLSFATSPNMVREAKHLSRNFKQIAWQCFTLLNILIWIVRSIYRLILNSSIKNYTEIACI